MGTTPSNLERYHDPVVMIQIPDAGRSTIHHRFNQTEQSLARLADKQATINRNRSMNHRPAARSVSSPDHGSINDATVHRRHLSQIHFQITPDNSMTTGQPDGSHPAGSVSETVEEP
ncbi:hypothetical protein PHET_01884 [Paragonimus heterotremus]|uniref:Uncharacterized protein n=1 Tax=Paragonimus heterotremus TaxID=100268 RepID=A0A8J4SRF1_9TREM|nr:hypothetical protein PHET_01884 [Paragonimus heterotremus]